MPIHDQGYRRYRGGKAPLGRAWGVIATTGLRSLFRSRAFLALLVVSWMQFLIRSVQIYAAANLPQAAMLAPTAATFRDFFDKQDLFVFILSIYVGAGLVANDRRANALQLYLSKPLTRGEYVLGKLTVLMSSLLLVTGVPALMLLIVQVSFAGSFEFLRHNAQLLPAIVVFSLVETIFVSAIVLALSSLSRSSRFVGILYAVLVFFTEAIFGVLRLVTGQSALSGIAPGGALEQVGDLVFRVPLRYQTPWPASLVVVALLVALSVLILERRIRAVEIVA
jgi:ABC-2 type transport system permease protein